MNNGIVLKTFLKQMDECLEDIIKTYPSWVQTDRRFVKCKMYFETLKSSNPKSMIVAWKRYVNDKYRKEIDANNIEFFITKNYKNDVDIEYDDVIETSINDLRETIMNMSEENQRASMKYIQNLCKLCDHYV